MLWMRNEKIKEGICPLSPLWALLHKNKNCSSTISKSVKIGIQIDTIGKTIFLINAIHITRCGTRRKCYFKNNNFGLLR